MKTTTAGVLILAGVLTGCTEQPYEEDDARLINEIATSKMDSESAELREFLDTAKRHDPSVTDAYYTYNGAGERQLVVVREKEGDSDDDNSALSTFLLAGMGGLAGAALASAMMSPSGSHYNTYREAPKSYYSRSALEDKKREDRGTYISSAYSQAAAGRAAASTTSGKLSTSKPAFSGGSSTRSGSYGGSGG